MAFPEKLGCDVIKRPTAGLRVGCAGWVIPKPLVPQFPELGSHLARYAHRLSAVEVNSCFYRSHRPATYARWACQTPAGFAFSLKLPRSITHDARLVNADGALDRFLEETAELGAKRGPLLVQLPPSLAFDARVAGDFLSGLRRRHDGDVACEPRHRTWFGPEPDRLLASFRVARVAADPATVPQAAEPGGWHGLVYYRLHGSPKMYYSAYPADRLVAVARLLAEAATSGARPWCIFDNTALGGAVHDALAVVSELGGVCAP
jgi:uncharacterized protein YecE (DUF72 family)